MNPPEPSTQPEATQEIPLPPEIPSELFAEPPSQLLPEPLPPPPQPSVQPARTPTRVVRRKAILSDDSVAGKPDSPAVSNLTYTVQQAGPGANQRRQRQNFKQTLAIVLVNDLLIAGAVVWFVYSSFGDIQSRLQSAPPPQRTAPQASAPTVAPNTIDTEAIEKRASTLEAKLTQQITDLQKKLGDSTEQLEAAQKERQATEQKLDELTRRVAGVTAEVQNRPKEAAPPSDAANTTIASSETKNPLDLPPSQAELVLLKERNRLTAYADEAIATGSREPYEELWKAISDPRLANLVHAARAEILRVQECYLSAERAKYYGIAQYQIPISELLPDAGSLTAAQLNVDQLIQILGDQKAPWQARVKAAWQLGRHRSTKVGDALVKAVKEDPMLDVEAEATYSFEQVTGYHSKLFEPENLSAWWESYKAAPPSNNAAKSEDKNAAAEKKPAKSEKGSDEKSPPEQVKKPTKPDDDKDSSKDKDDKKKKDKPTIPLREPDEKP